MLAPPVKLPTRSQNKMKKLFLAWLAPNCRPPQWMALAYYSAERKKTLFVAFPFNLLIALAWWIQDRWARAAHESSWIDREAEARIHERAKRIRWR
jgi:hypothetical protein